MIDYKNMICTRVLWAVEFSLNGLSASIVAGREGLHGSCWFDSDAKRNQLVDIVTVRIKYRNQNPSCASKKNEPEPCTQSTMHPSLLHKA